MAERDVAIATPVPGTTRDRLEAPVLRDGIAWLLIDVAGLRDDTDDPIEAIGIDRARAAMAEADIVLWLGDDPPPAPGMIALHSRSDDAARAAVPPGRLPVSAATGQGVAELWQLLGRHAIGLLPRTDQVAFNRRQLAGVADAAEALLPSRDAILFAEHLRRARAALDGVTGSSDVERLLDDVFGRFCIGK
jgi:tRNA modification GTPase